MSEPAWTDAMIADFSERLAAALTPAAQARHRKREMRRLLTRRTRTRLWCTERVDGLAIWRASRMWHG